MRKWLLSLGVLVGLFAVALHAQDIVGTWQGTLQIQGRDLRMVFKVTNDGGLKATIYSIDQGGGAGLPGTVTLQGATVKVTIPGVGGTYDGRVGGDGNTIEGTFAQAGAPSLKLDLKKANAETAGRFRRRHCRQLMLMPANADPSFEVATIKPSRPETPGQMITVRGRTFSTLNQTVRGMLTFAYGLHPDQIVGGRTGSVATGSTSRSRAGRQWHPERKAVALDAR